MHFLLRSRKAHEVASFDFLNLMFSICSENITVVREEAKHTLTVPFPFINVCVCVRARASVFSIYSICHELLYNIKFYGTSTRQCYKANPCGQKLRALSGTGFVTLYTT